MRTRCRLCHRAIRLLKRRFLTWGTAQITMNPFVRALLVIVILLISREVAAAPIVVRRTRIHPTSEYQVAASAAGAAWGNDADNETASHVSLHLENKRATLNVGLPARIPLASAEVWLQDLVDRLGWNDVRLYSSQNASQVRVEAQVKGRTLLVGPFQRRAFLDLQLLQSRLQQLTRGRVLLCVRISDAAVLSAKPPPSARGVLKGETYLFYSELPRAPAQLVVTYGLTTRQVLALSMAVALWLLFPLVVLQSCRNHLVHRPDLSDETRQRIYVSWQRGVRLAGMSGALLTFAVLHYSRVVPGFFSPALSLLFPLWWWYGASEKLVYLPNAENSGAEVLSRWLSVAGDVALACLGALVLLAPYYATPSTLSWLANLIPLVVGGGGAFLLLGSLVMVVVINRVRRGRGVPIDPVATIPDDPAAVRELLQKLTDEIEAEEPIAVSEFEKATPSFAVRYALAMYTAMQALDVDQRAALKTSDQLAMGGVPVKAQSPFTFIWSLTPLVVAGLVAWFVPGPVRFVVLLTGTVLTWVFGIAGSRLAAGTLNSLQHRLEDADMRVAAVMDDPSRLLDALWRLGECDRLHRPQIGGVTREPSIHEARRLKLARRLGLDQ